MNGNSSFRIAFVVTCILLILGYILLQVQLYSDDDRAQIQILPFEKLTTDNRPLTTDN